MRQTFQFTASRHKPAQAIAALKNKIRKYIKRERRKPLPEGADFWGFDCRVGPEESAAVPVPLAEIIPQLDALVAAGGSQIYVEILAKPERRPARAVHTDEADD